MKKILIYLVLPFLVTVECTGCQVSPTKSEQTRIQTSSDSLSIGRLRELEVYLDSMDVRFSGKSDSLFSVLFSLSYGDEPKHLSHLALSEKIDTARILEKISMLSQSDNQNFLLTIKSLEPQAAQYQLLKKQYIRLLRESKTDSLALIHESLNAFRWIQRFTDSTYALVNIPAADLFVSNRAGAELLRMRVIVGSRTHQTPAFATICTEIITYPYWNVPRSIALNEILPKVKRNRGYLSQNNMQVIGPNGHVLDPAALSWASYSASNFPYRFRQSTGCDNALGLVKFNLKSPFSIYMHDTNSRSLFSRSSRWLSHGCIRLQKPTELANLILNEPIFDEQYLDQCRVGARPGSIQVVQPFPVFILYLPADIDGNGQLRWNSNVYNW